MKVYIALAEIGEDDTFGVLMPNGDTVQLNYSVSGCVVEVGHDTYPALAFHSKTEIVYISGINNELKTALAMVDERDQAIKKMQETISGLQKELDTAKQLAQNSVTSSAAPSATAPDAPTPADGTQESGSLPGTVAP